MAHDKLEGPSTTITFLGLELDSVSREIRLPMDKLVSLLDQLNHWPMGHKTTKRKLLSLIGMLSFATKAWFTICRKGLATHALTLTATQLIARIDSNSIPAFRCVAFKRQIEKFCVDSIYSSLAKFNATPLRDIVNQA